MFNTGKNFVCNFKFFKHVNIIYMKIKSVWKCTLVAIVYFYCVLSLACILITFMIKLMSIHVAMLLCSFCNCHSVHFSLYICSRVHLSWGWCLSHCLFQQHSATGDWGKERRNMYPVQHTHQPHVYHTHQCNTFTCNTVIGQTQQLTLWITGIHTV